MYKIPVAMYLDIEENIILMRLADFSVVLGRYVVALRLISKFAQVGRE